MPYTRVLVLKVAVSPSMLWTPLGVVNHNDIGYAVMHCVQVSVMFRLYASCVIAKCLSMRHIIIRGR